MRIFSTEIRTIEFRSLLISLLSHLIFASCIVLTFTFKGNPSQPSFVFLGPLLAENDFRILAAQGNPSNPAQTLSTIKTKPYSNPIGPLNEVPKPMFSGEKSSQEKAFLKSSFIAPEEKEPSANDNDRDMGIDSLPERTPLKLDLK